MKPYLTYEVIEEYDRTNDYGIKIFPRIAKCLSILKKGQNLTTAQYLKDNDLGRLGHRGKLELIYKTFSIAKKIGILTVCRSNNHVLLQEFSNLETVAYCLDQLRPSKRRNVKPNGEDSTQRCYLYSLWDFHRWLVGKEFEYSSFVPIAENRFEARRGKIVLEGLEHLLSLYKKSHDSQPDFIHFIKKYLLSPKHEGKKESSLKILYHAIIAYFDRNESPIHFKINFNANHTSLDEQEQHPNLSLEDLFKMLTVGKPTVTQKAVILCKFHRGLDTSTFVDRFNFQVWPQLVSWLETEDYEKWNVSKCPVPIKLTRIKTSFNHTGFLDIDTIEAIRDYLRFREEKTGTKMKDGEALFLNERNNPITDSWIRMKFFTIATRAGIQKKIKDYVSTVRYEKDSHELRDLLKSTLIECGCRYDVADHCIGHKPKDSYEKQMDLYSESTRLEYMKASPKLNIFTNLSNSLKGHSEIPEIQKENVFLKAELARQSQAIDYLLSKEH